MRSTFGKALLFTIMTVVTGTTGCGDDSVSVEPPRIAKMEMLVRNLWFPASPAVSMDGVTTLPANNRQLVRWYNAESGLGATKRDFNPGLSNAEDGQVLTMHIEVDTIPPDSEHWVGVMTGFPGFFGSSEQRPGLDPLDLSESTFLEIWINDFKPDPADRGGKVYIELGFIDEDFYQPDLVPPRFHHEDANRDGFAAASEDTGLDGIFTGQPADDPDDDFDPQPGGLFTGINGTEGNLLLDSEDLDGSGQMETLNAYFRYEVDLTATAKLDVRSAYPDYTGFKHPDDSWRLYQIRLSDYDVVMPDGRIPYRDRITHLRIWFDDIGAVLNPDLKYVQIGGLKATR